MKWFKKGEIRMMKISRFQSEYTDEVLRLWNQTMVADPLSKQRFLELIVTDDNFDADASVAALYNGKVVGFVWAVYRKVAYGERGLEPERGWIVSIMVSPDFQRQGIGSQLVKYVETIFRERAISRVTLGAYSPNYLFPGIDIQAYKTAIPFFEQHGYEVSSHAVSMEYNIFGYRQSTQYLQQKKAVEELGYKILPLSLDRVEELIAFLHTHFEGGWSRNIKVALQRGNLLETVLIAVEPGGKIVGYAQRAMDGNPSRFGPFGVREDLRGLRLGMILFNEMIFDMFSRGIYHAYFLWTTGSNIQFYERNGMKIYREYRLGSKKIK